MVSPDPAQSLPALSERVETQTSTCVCVSGVYADKIGIEAAEMLLRNIRHNGCVDEFLQDQVRDTPADRGLQSN